MIDLFHGRRRDVVSAPDPAPPDGGTAGRRQGEGTRAFLSLRGS
jgi:hypothetical protein